jgi:hypothetical protein
MKSCTKTLAFSGKIVSSRGTDVSITQPEIPSRVRISYIQVEVLSGVIIGADVANDHVH